MSLFLSLVTSLCVYVCVYAEAVAKDLGCPHLEIFRPLCGCVLRRKHHTPLRAKGTLISEPQFSTPCEMQFSRRETGKRPFSRKMAAFPFSRWKNRIYQGVDYRGSLISVPLALRSKIVSGKIQSSCRYQLENIFF